MISLYPRTRNTTHAAGTTPNRGLRRLRAHAAQTCRAPERNTMKQGFLIDMDGVIYRGNEMIQGAVEFVAALRARKIPFLFLTNNSQRTRRDMAIKLRRRTIRSSGQSER